MRRMASKTRVAYLIDTISCSTGGTEKQLLQTLERLDRRSFDPCLICLRESAWLEANNVPCEVITLGYKGFVKVGIFAVLQKLAKVLEERKIDIVSTFFKDSIFVAYLGQVLNGSGLVLLSNRRDVGLGNEPWYHMLYDWVFPVVNRRYDGIIANSNAVKAHVVRLEGVAEEKVKVVHNGISIPSRVNPAPAIFQEEAADVWIGLVASSTQVKRIDVFLRALARLRQFQSCNLKIRALILGDGPERNGLGDLAWELGLKENLHFLGSVPDVIPYVQHLDIGVLCSDREGFSNAILEYMACSLPVVATNVGGNPELVDASNGFCVPPGDPDALAKALEILILDLKLRQIMGQRSLSKVRESYSWDKAMSELENYYHTLLESR